MRTLLQAGAWCGLLMATTYCGTTQTARAPSSDPLPVPQGCGRINYPSDSFENGFVALDVLHPTVFGRGPKSDPSKDKIIQPLMCPQDLEKAKALKLQPYKPLYTFVEEKQTRAKKAKNRAKLKIKEEPWVGQNLDVTKYEDAEKVAKLLQRYVYEGWFDTDKTPGKTDLENQFRENSLRTWCQTPWLQATEKGREAIHGLTKEFPVRTTHVYEVPRDVEVTEDAVTWGVAFFNDKVCNKYQGFFKEKQAMIPQLRDKSPNFMADDGAVSFKLLFNTMPNWEHKMKGQWTSQSGDLKAYNWWAHVSHARQDDGKTPKDESIRELLNVAHVQMDIGLKDSRLLGTNPLLKSWVMTTYYFDPTYKNEFLADMQIPEALKHMRPLGLQYGLDAGESHIFDGAHNNHFPPEVKVPVGTDSLPAELDRYKTRLNGPVDNINGSCLGCHAASGVRFNVGPMTKTSPNPPMVFTSNKQYQDFLNNMKKNNRISADFDFNMQLDKAMRNFFNSKHDKIEQMPEPQK